MTLRVVALRGGVAHDPRSSSSTSTSSLARRSIRSWPAFRPFSDHRAPKDPHRSAGVISAVDRSRKVGKALEVSPRTVFRTMAEPKSERERERERERKRQRKREKERVRLDIARGSMQHCRTSSWTTTVATPASSGFLFRLSLSHCGRPSSFTYEIPRNPRRERNVVDFAASGWLKLVVSIVAVLCNWQWRVSPERCWHLLATRELIDGIIIRARNDQHVALPCRNIVDISRICQICVKYLKQGMKDPEHFVDLNLIHTSDIVLK